MSIKFPDITDTIFFEPGKTDDLMAELDRQRDEMRALHAQSVEKGLELSEVVAHLQLMEEKTVFFAEMVEKTEGVFVPPKKGEGEVGMSHIQTLVFDNMSKFSNLTALLGAPIMIDLMFRAGLGTGFVSTTGRVSRVMKGGKYLKVMKFAKGALALTVAVELAGFVMNMIASKEMNEKLRVELGKLEKEAAKGRKQHAQLVAGLADAKKQRDTMLAQAKVKTPEDYVRVINEGLAEMGRQKANFDTARRMLQHGMDTTMILSMLDNMAPETLDLIAMRLKAETMLAAGQPVVDVGAELGLSEDQMGEIAAVVDARDAIIRGDTPAEIADMLTISIGMLNDVDEALDDALPDLWSEIEGTGPLAPHAARLLARVPALEDLRAEIKGKALLSQNGPIGEVSAQTGASRKTVVEWASALPVAREEAMMLQAQGITDPEDVAAATRLPLALVAA